MLDIKSFSFDQYTILQYIINEIGSHKLKYSGPYDFLLAYVHKSLYEKYSIIRTAEGVGIRSKEDPDKPVLLSGIELTFQKAVKELLGTCIDTGYEQRQLDKLKYQERLEEAKKADEAYENSLAYQRAKSVAKKNEEVVRKIEYEH